MNIAKLALRQWLPMYEASHYLTSKLNCGPYGSENAISGRDVLDLALAGRVPLTLNIPPGMKDKQGRELEDGLWDLLMKRERGKPGRRQVKHQLNQKCQREGHRWGLGGAKECREKSRASTTIKGASRRLSLGVP